MRRGNWSRVPGVGWQLDGTRLILDYDRLDGSCALYGSWILYRDSSGGAGRYLGPIDHYLDGAMEYVEQNLADFEPLTLLSDASQAG